LNLEFIFAGAGSVPIRLSNWRCYPGLAMSRDEDLSRLRRVVTLKASQRRLFAVRCSLFGVRCSCSLFAVRCSLFAVRCSSRCTWKSHMRKQLRTMPAQCPSLASHFRNSRRPSPFSFTLYSFACIGLRTPVLSNPSGFVLNYFNVLQKRCKKRPNRKFTRYQLGALIDLVQQCNSRMVVSNLTT